MPRKTQVTSQEPDTPQSTRGPGTLQRRINRIKESLSKAQVEQAETLAADTDYEVLRLAHYINTVAHEQKTREERIKLYSGYLARLSATTAP